jgi:small subunit ribosomal protein S11
MGKRTIATTEKEGTEKPVKPEKKEQTVPKTVKAPKETKAQISPAGAKAVTPASGQASSSTASNASANVKKRIEVGILHVQSTYNNTKLLLTDTKGNAIASASAGSLGFKGAKKGTPFAAAKVGETLSAKVQPMGLKEVSIIVKGTGSGRESSIRGFTSKGINISSIKDATPVPFNGPKAPRARRV